MELLNNTKRFGGKKMKKIIYFMISLFIFSASAFSAAFKGPGLGGASGLIGIPTARTSWEGTGRNSIGLDAGMHYITEGEAMTPKALITLFERFEIGALYLGQDRNNAWGLNSKFRFAPWSGRGNSAIAIGFRMDNGITNEGTVNQLYLASTYGGKFFGMNAETTMVLGKSFGDFVRSGDIDFGMGFELEIFRSLFRGYVHWITDFSNFSWHNWSRSSTVHRGVFNTGMRIAVLKFHSRLKFDIDVLGTDLLDDNRGFALGGVFGLRI